MEREINGNDIFLFIDPTGGTNYSTLVCLTTKSIQRTTTSIETATQCGLKSAPGDNKADVTFDGVQMWDPASGRISGANLHDLWAVKAIFGWKVGVALPQDDDITYSGKGFLTSLSDTYGAGNSTFQGQFQVVGDITKVEASGAIATLGSITAGTLYTNGVYTDVPLTGGAGLGATADITVSGGSVTACILDDGGSGYVVGNTLTALAANIGGTGSGFSIPVATIIP